MTSKEKIELVENIMDAEGTEEEIDRFIDALEEEHP